MIQDKTYKVKVWDHNDAVICVYEQHYRQKPDPKDADKKIHWRETKVLTVIPIDKHYEEEEDDFIKKVQATVKALTDLYENTPDYEIGISYTFNNSYVNCY